MPRCSRLVDTALQPGTSSSLVKPPAQEVPGSIVPLRWADSADRSVGWCAKMDFVGSGSGYWVDGPGGCPIGGPFELWRQNYFFANGEPPEDLATMYPALSAETVAGVATATVTDGATLEEVLRRFGDRSRHEQLTMAHNYFKEWRKRFPFMQDSMQALPLRPARTSREPLDEFLEDWQRIIHDNGSSDE